VPQTVEIPTELEAALADRYTLRRVLGRGGMATVYLADDRKHHRAVALKVPVAGRPKTRFARDGSSTRVRRTAPSSRGSARESRLRWCGVWRSATTSAQRRPAF
jgi:serine/threonine protein kinase